MAEKALATPTKRFFLDMLVRDISLEDAILDLIDNAIDSLIQAAGLQPNSDLFLSSESRPDLSDDFIIRVNLSEDEFSIQDNCGGIDTERARSDVFRFGKTNSDYSGSLSVYGIGLKRAIFKIGKDITVVSKTQEAGFKVKIDADKWVEDDSSEDPDWTFPLETISSARSEESAGTTITVKRLKPETTMRLRDGSFLQRVRKRVAETYSLFLGRYVSVEINDRRVQPHPIPLGMSEDLSPGVESFTQDRVEVEIIAGLAAQPWRAEQAGWYVLCNGRVVVIADKSDLTGWGTKAPSFVPKYRGFLGVVFFFSNYPEDLPWTTTKRGLNTESATYQKATNRMHVLARPVLKFLDAMYASSSEVESEYQRELAEQVKSAPLSTLSKSDRTFTVPESTKKAARLTSVQFRAKNEDLQMVRRCLRKPNWSASKIGKYALEYLIEQECSE